MLANKLAEVNLRNNVEHVTVSVQPRNTVFTAKRTMQIVSHVVSRNYDNMLGTGHQCGRENRMR